MQWEANGTNHFSTESNSLAESHRRLTIRFFEFLQKLKEAPKNYCARSCCVEIRLKMLIYILQTALFHLISPCLTVARYLFQCFLNFRIIRNIQSLRKKHSFELSVILFLQTQNRPPAALKSSGVNINCCMSHHRAGMQFSSWITAFLFLLNRERKYPGDSSNTR